MMYHKREEVLEYFRHLNSKAMILDWKAMGYKSFMSCYGSFRQALDLYKDNNYGIYSIAHMNICVLNGTVILTKDVLAQMRIDYDKEYVASLPCYTETIAITRQDIGKLIDQFIKSGLMVYRIDQYRWEFATARSLRSTIREYLIHHGIYDICVTICDEEVFLVRKPAEYDEENPDPFIDFY